MLEIIILEPDWDSLDSRDRCPILANYPEWCPLLSSYS